MQTSPLMHNNKSFENNLRHTMRLLIVLIFVFICLVFSCRKEDSAISESDKLSVTLSSKHFDYFKSESDFDILDTSWQEKYYVWMIGQLKIMVPEKIQFNKYRDKAHKERLTGTNGNGFAELGTYKFHTIWKADNHECVHVVVTQLGLVVPADEHRRRTAGQLRVDQAGLRRARSRADRADARG